MGGPMQIPNRSRAVLFAVALAAAGIAAPALCQTVAEPPAALGAPAPQNGVSQGREQIEFYANSHPYMDDSLPELKHRVPELNGLKDESDPASKADVASRIGGNGDPLPALLSKLGANVNELAQKIPNMVADEKVSEREWVSGARNDCASGPSCAGPPSQEKIQNFHYLILVRQTPQGRLLDENRMDMQNRPLGPGSAQPNFQGFVESWVVFSPGNADEARFRYLGEQKIHGHPAFVIAFAQIPGAVHIPGVIHTIAGRSVPMLLQGIVWISQQDYQILQLRTDLLEPQLEVNVLQQTSEIQFGPVRIKQLNLTLWLPLAVDVDCEANGTVLQEKHFYSKYHLYRATTRMILNPGS